MSTGCRTENQILIEPHRTSHAEDWFWGLLTFVLILYFLGRKWTRPEPARYDGPPPRYTKPLRSYPKPPKPPAPPSPPTPPCGAAAPVPPLRLLRSAERMGSSSPRLYVVKGSPSNDCPSSSEPSKPSKPSAS